MMISEWNRVMVKQAYGESLGRYTAKTFGWMFIGLLITFGVAIGMYMTNGLYYVSQVPGWYYILFIAENRYCYIPVCTDDTDDSWNSKSYVFPVCSCKWYCIQHVFPDLQCIILMDGICYYCQHFSVLWH